MKRLSPVTVKAGEIISNSIRINELTPKDENAESAFVLLGVAQDGNTLHIVESVVNRFTSELQSVEVLYSINAKEKSTAVQNAPSVSTPNYRTTISISELIDYVKDYFPDILPEDVLKHYGYDRNVGKINKFFADKTSGSLFGDYTESAVKVYQAKNKLEVDGRIGKLTLSAMEKDGFIK